MNINTEYLEDRREAWKIGLELIGMGFVGVFLSWLVDANEFQKFLLPTLSVVIYLISLIVHLARASRDFRQADAIAVTNIEIVKEKARAYLLEAKALKEQADAITAANTKQANDLQALSKERQVLQEQMQTLSKKLAIANQAKADADKVHAESLQVLKQSEAKRYNALLSQLNKAKEELNQIEKARVEEKVKKAANAYYSSLKGDLEAVKEKMFERSRKENEPMYLDYEKYLNK